MALTAGRLLEERKGDQASYPVAPGATGFQGGLAMLAAGVLVRAVAQATAAAAAGCQVVGIAEHAFAGAADGSTRAQTRRGCFLFLNSAGADAIALSDVGQPAYVVDDETVALTSNINVRPRAGTIVDVESAGVWVRVGVGS